MKKLSNWAHDQIVSRASDKLEGQLFFAFKKLEELELQRDGVLFSEFEIERIESMLDSQRREIDVLNFMYELVHDKLNLINKR